MVPGGASSRSREIVSFDIDPVLLHLICRSKPTLRTPTACCANSVGHDGNVRLAGTTAFGTPNATAARFNPATQDSGGAAQPSQVACGRRATTIAPTTTATPSTKTASCEAAWYCWP